MQSCIFPGDLVELESLLSVCLVERLGPYLEAQPLHLFVNGIIPFVKDAGLVRDAIVEFGVDDIIKRCNLRESIRNGIQEGLPAVEILSKADNHHGRSGLACTNEHRAQYAMVLPDIIEWDAMLKSILFDKEPNTVGWFRLQIALLQIEDLIEKFADMEAKAATLGVGEPIGIFVRKYPPAVRCGKFKFIPIEFRTFRRECGKDLRNIQMADTHELVVYLASLGFQLERIGEWLPFASPANAEVLAERLQPVCRRLFYLRYNTFKIVLLFLDYPDVHDISRHCERHEHHLSVRTVRNRLAFSSDHFNCNILQEEVDSFPCH